jgi:hypothetical protein
MTKAATMAATITASTTGMTSPFVMIEFDASDRALDPIVEGARLFDNQMKADVLFLRWRSRPNFAGAALIPKCAERRLHQKSPVCASNCRKTTGKSGAWRGRR